MLVPENFTEKLMEWYEKNGRDFFWRKKNLTSFQVLIVEMCLKRTKPGKVSKFGEKIVNRLSDTHALNSIKRAELENLIEPLGLQEKRTKELQALSKSLKEEFEGKVPGDRESLLSIDGVGPYVSDAVLCFGFGEPVIVVDPNVAEVGRKYFDISVNGRSGEHPELKGAIRPYLPEDKIEEFNWALIDLGTILRRNEGEGGPLEELEDL